MVYGPTVDGPTEPLRALTGLSQKRDTVCETHRNGNVHVLPRYNKEELNTYIGTMEILYYLLARLF
jgi:hypothetical protein